jgi:hypothetical protein
MSNEVMLALAIRTLPLLGKGDYRGEWGPCAVGHMDNVTHQLRHTPVCEGADDIRACVSRAYGLKIDQLKYLEQLNDGVRKGRTRRHKVVKNILQSWLRGSQEKSTIKGILPRVIRRSASEIDIHKEVDALLAQLHQASGKEQGELVTV